MELPAELSTHILSFISDIKDVLSYALCCKVNREIVLKDSKTLVRKVMGIPKCERKTNRRFTSESFYFVDVFGKVQGSAFIFTVSGASRLRPGKKLCTKMTFLDGKKHGEFSRTFENILLEKGQYEEGAKEGIWELYDSFSTTRELWRQGTRMQTHSITKTGEGGWITDRCGTRYKFVSVSSLNGCEKAPAYIKYSAENSELYSHCCKKHQGPLPNSLF